MKIPFSVNTQVGKTQKNQIFNQMQNPKTPFLIMHDEYHWATETKGTFDLLVFS